MALEMFCDDGLIAYIDGQEVCRWNMPTSAPDRHTLLALQSVFNDDELVKVTTVFDVGEIPPGEHTLAISLHNSSANSSDLGIRALTVYGSKERSQNEDTLKAPEATD